MRTLGEGDGVMGKGKESYCGLSLGGGIKIQGKRKGKLLCREDEE